jgi:hypothetical protein
MRTFAAEKKEAQNNVLSDFTQKCFGFLVGADHVRDGQRPPSSRRSPKSGTRILGYSASHRPYVFNLRGAGQGEERRPNLAPKKQAAQLSFGCALELEIACVWPLHYDHRA